MASRDRRSRSNEVGASLLELVVVMAIAGVLMALGTYGFTSWRHTSQHQGAADELVSTLRGASVQAISEGRTYCVDVKSGGASYELWRYSCGGSGAVQVEATHSTQDVAVTYAATVTTPTPAPACPSGSTCLYFYPRGTALPASVTVASTHRSKTYTVRVEGLTSRVYL